MNIKKIDIVIIGGGLGGLTAAILLAKNGRSVTLVEKKNYPFHRVCGEYISNEVKAFLQKENLFPGDLAPTEITRFKLTSSKGRTLDMKLDLGGFGISRYAFDEYLYQKAQSSGVKFRLNEQVEQVEFLPKDDEFRIELRPGEFLLAKHLLGAFGKRSKIDKVLSRSFMDKRTPYIGIKYHIKGDFDPDTIALHHFDGGYCGLNPIENGLFNLCYLGNKNQLRDCGSIAQMEERHLYQNHHLKTLFREAEFIREKPEVINEINFEPKLPVEGHLLMIGDAGGMIAPLCGNGMAIAIHTGKLAAEALMMNTGRQAIEDQYRNSWDHYFKQRLASGRMVQKLFDYPWMAESAIALLHNFPYLAKQIMKRTHGKPF